jgi:plastocyanin
MKTRALAMAALLVPAAATFATEGTSRLTATVSFQGTPPVMKKLHTEADPFCSAHALVDQQVLVKNGKLANVMVRVVKGATGTFAPPSTPIVVLQSGCTYLPRVQGALAGQPITVRSEDLTNHNIHVYVGEETIFNRAQNKGEFTKPGSAFRQDNGPIAFQCDIHPWMVGYVVVNPNPYFAVTDSSGVARIDLPPGTYTLEAWHERFGTKTQTVTVEPGKPASIEFQFSNEDRAH